MQAVGVQPPPAPAAVGLRNATGLPASAWLRVARCLAGGLSKLGPLRAVAALIAAVLDDEGAWRCLVLRTAAPGAPICFRGAWRATALGQRGARGLRRAAAGAWRAVCPPAPGPAAGGSALARLSWEAAAGAPLRDPGRPALIAAGGALGSAFVGWPTASWTSRTLRRRYGDRLFTVALPGPGTVHRMRLSSFLRYAALNRDFAPVRWDSEPLYLFDPRPPLSLRAALREPRLCHAPDLARACPALREALRAAARGWLLVGGAGSGSRFHVDALGSGAWSACLEGRKRWAMYPPSAGVPPGVLTPAPGRYASPSPLFWFSEVLPALPADRRPPVDVVAEAGDIVYIPPGWWHCVLNLGGPTVAFTRNVVYGFGAVRGVVGALEAAQGHAGVAAALRELAWRQHCDE